MVEPEVRRPGFHIFLGHITLQPGFFDFRWRDKREWKLTAFLKNRSLHPFLGGTMASNRDDKKKNWNLSPQSIHLFMKNVPNSLL